MGINEILQGVMAVVSARFPEAEVVSEEGQPPESGSFFVRMSSGSQERLLGRSHRRLYNLDIRYDGTTYADRNAAAEQLYDALRMIIVQETALKATTMSHEMIEGVLHFTVQYPVRVVEELPVGIRMQTLEQEGVVG